MAVAKLAVRFAAPVSAAPPPTTQLAIVGGGILGLALARELLRRHPQTSLVVLEKEAEVATHQTGHNSGVVHAGIYYVPGSLKAKLCVEGAHELYAFCEERGIAHERCGKLIVATDPSELGGLEELERRGRANGVPDLARVDAAGIERIEPHARGIAALHSPFTGIVDFPGVARALADDVRAAGGEIVTGCEIRAIEGRDGAGVRLLHAGGAVEARHLVSCAGAWSDRVAVAAGASPDPRIVPFRGAYLRLKPERRHLVRGLIYPVPDPSLPFLGVHLTKHTSGDILVGPTALLSPGRDAYSLATWRPRDLRDTLAWPGSWRMFRRWWRTGMVEMRHAAWRGAFVRAAARFVPDLRASDVEPAFAGVRAQALGRDGKLVDDFVFSETPGALHVRNAPSPGATSSLAIARLIADRADAAFR
jgi:2-hydroxyglutarate dehydrogenase